MGPVPAPTMLLLRGNRELNRPAGAVKRGRDRLATGFCTAKLPIGGAARDFWVQNVIASY